MGAIRVCAILCWLAPVSASQAGSLETFYHPEEASLSLSGSLRQIGLYTRGTDAKRFEAAIVTDIGAGGTACTSADTFNGCPAIDLIGKRDVGLGSTRLRVAADLRLRDGLSLVVAYDNEADYRSLDTLEGRAGSALGSESFLGAEDKKKI